MKFLTDKTFDAQRFNLHINKQATVCFHKGWSQGHTGFGMGQFDHSCSYAVNKAGKTESHVSLKALLY